MTPKEKGEDGGEPRAESPEPPPEQTPFQRFEEFVRRVISVPRVEIEEREREYQEYRKRTKP